MNDLTRNPHMDYRTADAVAVLAHIKQQLVTMSPDIEDDENLLIDMLEGEGGDALDVIKSVVRASIDARMIAEAADSRIANLRDRRDRMRRRAETLRSVAFTAMDRLGIRNLPDAEFTASISTGTASVVVTDDGLLPDNCVRIKREPDKAAIAKLLKAGTHVPGAILSNSEPTLVVRTK